MRRIVLGLTVCCALFACDALPTRAIPTAPSGSVSTSSYSATAALPTPAYGGFVGEPVLTAPSGGWYKLTFSGSISISLHPGVSAACAEYEAYWKQPYVCPLPLEGATVGPEGLLSCAKLSNAGCNHVLAILNVCAFGGGCTSPYLPAAVPGFATGDLLFVHEGYPFTVTRSGPSDTWQAGSRVFPAYTFSGAHNISVQKVAAPFGVAVDSSAALFGGKMRFTSGVPEPWEWVFVPGDTAADPQMPASLEHGLPRITLCNLQSYCEYRPRSSGRMYVRGRMSNLSYGWGTGPAVTVGQEATVVLQCMGDRGPNAVTRGTEIVCTAAKNPANAPGELSVLGWGFRGTARIDGEVTSQTWRGIMAEGGEVTLRARIGSASPELRRATVAVASRNWVDHLPPARVERVSCEHRTPTCPQTRMEQERDAGLSYLPMEGVDVSRFHVAPIVEGPNAGWWYVGGSEPPVRLPSPVIRLNPGVFDPRNALYRSARTCDPGDVQHWITTHENTHIAIGQERAAAGFVNGELEGRTGYGTRSNTRFYDQTVGALESRLEQLLDPDHTLSNRYPVPPCDLRLRANSING